MELDDAKEKNRNLENVMTEGEKKLKKKVNTLENNLEQLTNMYHQLASQKNKWNLDAQVVYYNNLYIFIHISSSNPGKALLSFLPILF